jgi:hypothetical protein
MICICGPVYRSRVKRHLAGPGSRALLTLEERFLQQERQDEIPHQLGPDRLNNP